MQTKQKSFKSTVAIKKATYSKMDLTSLLIPLGGFEKYIKRGDRVVLKVNLLSASTPSSAVVTHPAVVRAVAEAVLKVGGEPTIGDSPSREFTKSRLDNVYEYSGLKHIAAELGIELNYNTKSSKVRIQNGKKLKKAPIANFALNADKIIAVPKLKTHSLMILTLATKIMYGVIPGLTKARYHSMYFTRKGFADMLLDILSVVPPDLIIMDGIVGMQGDGPYGGDLVELGLLLASDDAVAMDLAICMILNIEPVGVPTLKRAKIRGLWPNSIDYPLLSPTDVYYPTFRLPSTASYILTGKDLPRRSPVIKKNCTGCGDCQKVCPKKAVKVINDKAIVDYNLCIQCYCCHEVCPEKAIKLEAIEK